MARCIEYVREGEGLKENTEIRRILLGLTLDCNMKCKYCYIKFAKKKLTKKKINEIFKILIENKGKSRQLIYLYGGEPLMALESVKYVIEQRNKLYAEQRTCLDIIIVTNGTIINKEILTLLKNNRTKIMISISGKKKTNDKYRVFDNGQGTYSVILPNIKKILSKLDKDDVWLSYTLVPEMSKNLFKDILYFENLGLRNFHIEPVLCEGYDWTEYFEVFEQELQKFLDYLFLGALKKKYLMFSVLSRQMEILLGHVKPSQYVRYNDLRIYPDVRLSYNHFELNGAALYDYGVWKSIKFQARKLGKRIVKNHLRTYTSLILENAI